jgi:membrane protein YqaA with SNARE-associated domain
MADDREPESHPEGGTPEERARYLRELDRARRMRVAKVVVGLVLTGILIAFVVQNYSEFARVHFVFVERRSRLFWVFVVCALLGGLAGYLLARPSKEQRRILKDSRRAGKGK